MRFDVLRKKGRWTVRKDDEPYGAYLSGEEAVLDAREAARDAMQCGREAQVWVRERNGRDTARIL